MTASNFKQFLAAAALLTATVSGAHAEDSFEVCGPQLDLRTYFFTGKTNHECWLRIMTRKIQAGESFTDQECNVAHEHQWWLEQCADFEAKWAAEMKTTNPLARGHSSEMPLCRGRMTRDGCQR